MKKRSLKIEVAFAAVIVVAWGLLYVFMVDPNRSTSFAEWATGCAVLAFFIYCIRMFLAGAIFSERTEEMGLPAWVFGAIAAALLTAGVVLYFFRDGLFSWR